MSILIVSGSDKKQMTFAKYSKQINSDYAKSHGYDFKFYEEPDFYFAKGIGLTSAEQQTEKQNKIVRSSNWNKLGCIIRNLNEYDYILWIDADAFIMNHKLRIEDLFEIENSPFHFWLSPDAESLNVGVFLIKTSEFIHKLFEKWSMMGFLQNDYYNIGLSSGEKINNLEQAAFVKLLYSNWNNIMPKVRIMEAQKINAHFQNEYWVSPYLPHLQYKHNESWVLHLAGVHEKDRINISENFIKENVIYNG